MPESNSLRRCRDLDARLRGQASRAPSSRTGEETCQPHGDSRVSTSRGLTSCAMLATSLQMASPFSGSGGYAVTRKCWKNRRSSIVKIVGVDCRAGEGDPSSLVVVLGYSQSRFSRLQWLHPGRISSHFTFRDLQVLQPLRDFLCPFLGIGFRRMLVTAPRFTGSVSDSADSILGVEAPETDKNADRSI